MVTDDGVRLNETLENLKKLQIPPSAEIFDQLSRCLPSWVAAIIKNYKNGCYGSIVQERELL